ncbi:MAG: NifU family protein [Anaerolineae bacterium]|nr:MAG: NifU family protein [Anaerolineae bacterium]
MSDEQESNTLKSKVAKVLDEIRPMLQRDGGDVQLVDVVDGVVQVELQGACKGCPMSQMTLAFGIGRVLKSKIPEVVDIQPV